MYSSVNETLFRQGLRNSFLIVVIFILNQISMNVPVTHVRTAAPASTEWMSSRAAVNRNLLGSSVIKVSVYEMMWLLRNSRHLVSIVPRLFLTWNIQFLGINARLTPSFLPIVDSCQTFYIIVYPPCTKGNKISHTLNWYEILLRSERSERAGT